MTALVSIFAVSLVAVVILLVYKARALSNGGETFITKTFPEERDEELRNKFEKFVLATRKKLSKGTRRLVDLIVDKATHWFILSLKFLMRKATNIRDSVRGRRVLEKKGPASFYLKDIVEHKNKNIDKNGRIDE